MKIRISVLAVLFALPIFKMMAQGELGFGETDDASQSLYERVANIEQKFKAFNVYVNFAGNLNTQQEAEGEPWKTGFKARQLRLELKGQIGEKFYYRVRQRLNKSNTALSDGLAKATDYMMVGYRFDPKWLVSVGKMGQYFGGFEFDQNGIYVYQASDINNNADGSKLGTAVTWTPIKGQQFVAQVTAAYNDKLENEYAGITAQGIKASNAPLTYVGNWAGTFSDGLFRTKYSFLHRNLAKSNGSNVVVLGHSINGKWGRVFFDYAYEHDDFDFMRFCSTEASSYLAPNQKWLTDLSYHSIVARTDVKINPHLIVWGEGMFQTASCGSVAELNGFRKHYNYMAGIEYVPDPSYKIRYTLNYQGQYFDYSSKCGIPDRTTNKIEIGVLCRIKCF